MSLLNFIHVTIFFTIGVKLSNSEREHKIHNIVLYPEKYSWCSATQIQQIVASPGYEPVTIDNNVCVGACYSYSIPKTQPAEPGELIGPYCDSCQPAKIQCYHVTLHADKQNIEGPKTIQKRVQIILDCACTSCDKIRKDDCDISDQNTVELPSNLFLKTNVTNKTNPEEVPELLKMQHMLHDKMIKHKKANSYRTDINSTFNEELNEILDYQKMKDILDENDEDDEDDDDSSFEEDIIPVRHSFSFLAPPPTTEKPIEPVSGSSSGHHHHHLGEIQQVGETVEHLIKGPHGSMVLSPVEKLHIDSDALKANDEGLVISYENHRVQKANHDIIVN